MAYFSSLRLGVSPNKREKKGVFPADLTMSVIWQNYPVSNRDGVSNLKARGFQSIPERHKEGDRERRRERARE